MQSIKSTRKHQERVPAKHSKHLFAGRELKVPSEPNEFTSRPWYNLVVRIANPSSTVSANDISSAIVSQLGLETGTGITLRLHSVKFWGQLVPTSGSSVLTPVTLRIFDPVGQNTGTTARVLEEYTRFPDQVQRASVGFEYPLAQQCVSLTPNSGPQILSLVGAGTNSVLYFYISWRSSNTSATISKGWFS